MIQHPLYIFAILFLVVFASEWLCKNTFLKHVSTALLVIILGAILANLGAIPSASNASPIYEDIFAYVAPLSIFYLLLGVDLKRLRKAGGPMLFSFVVGAFATVAGVFIALLLIDEDFVFGANAAAIAGMMTGTYTGGSANFNALALHYGILREGALYTGIVVADNIITALWMLVTLSMPVMLNRIRKNAPMKGPSKAKLDPDREKVSPKSLSLILFMGVAAMLLSDELSQLTLWMGFEIPSILILTTLALVLAQFKLIRDIGGAKMLGLFAMYLFLTVVGAYCELTALIDVGEHAFAILLFTTTIVVVHGVVLVLAGWILKIDWAIIAIASQANIGGAGTALALSKSFKRDDLLLPAILAGSLGTGIGTYLGFFVAGTLL